MTVAGMGFRSGISADALLAAVDAALDIHGLEKADLDALAVLPRKADEPALAEAARRLGIALLAAGEADIASARLRVLTRSERSIAATGTGSAAEAAALAVAGSDSRLLGPRIIAGPATCAIARSGAGS